MKEIYSVCWNITEKCNEDCKFCFRTFANDLSFDDNKRIADKLINYGVEKITFAGGEPLLYENLFPLVEYIKNIRPNIILSITTNGLLVNNKNYEKILKYFDWISFSFDAIDDNYYKKVGRGKKHMKKNLQNLKLFENKINIKINTVVNKENLNQISEIWDTISKYNIHRWKIFRYYPINSIAKINCNRFNITNSEFNNLKEDISNITNFSNVQVTYNDVEEFETSYFNIYPNGAIKDKTGKEVANILKDSMKFCVSLIDLSNHKLRKEAFENFK